METKNASKHLFITSSLGFSLTELLTAAAIGSIVIIGAAQMIVGHIKTSAQTEALMRAQDTWIRVQHLIDQDIQEAECLSTNASKDAITITLPPCPSGNTITYELEADGEGKNLVRTGPPINQDGTLNLQANSRTDIVSNNIKTFSVEINIPAESQGEGGTSSIETGESAIATYSFNITDPAGFSYGSAKTTRARPRIRVID